MTPVSAQVYQRGVFGKWHILVYHVYSFRWCVPTLNVSMCPFGDFYVPTFPIPFQFKVVKLKANSYRPSVILTDLARERNTNTVPVGSVWVYSAVR